MSLERIKSSRTLRIALLALYYAAILITVIILQARGSFATPSFIYQGF